MNGQTQFDENELKLIRIAKRTMHILAKVIRDQDPKEVIKDQDLAELIGDKNLAEALADPELGKLIRDRLTPGLPQLNSAQEAMVIGQLGVAIFGELLKLGADEPDAPSDGSG